MEDNLPSRRQLKRRGRCCAFSMCVLAKKKQSLLDLSPGTNWVELEQELCGDQRNTKSASSGEAAKQKQPQHCGQQQKQPEHRVDNVFCTRKIKFFKAFQIITTTMIIYPNITHYKPHQPINYIPLHSTIILHSNTLICTANNYTTLNFYNPQKQHSITLNQKNYITSQYTSLHYYTRPQQHNFRTTLHCTQLQFTHSTTLHSITPDNTTLHYTLLHEITLHHRLIGKEINR